MIYDDFIDEDALKAYCSSLNARAKAAKLSSSISIAQLRDLILESAGQCAWCGKSVYRQEFEIDHIIPLSNGGNHRSDNLALACPDCNRRKASKHPARFAQETYARTGIMNALLRRVLDYYGLEASMQKSLFAADDETEESSATLPKIEDEDEPPPYIWGK